MENSKIEWTDHTANFWWGCMKVSPGCQHCYAETWASRWGKQIWGPAATTGREYKKAAWGDVPKWNAAALAAGVRKRVFVQSMADFFEDHPQVVVWRNAALRLMAECTSLDFQVLTKRPENIMQMLPTDWRPHKWGRIPDHIWIGASVENQEAANERIPALLAVPARVRFLSCEPLLGPVDIARAIPCGYYCDPDIYGGGHHDHAFLTPGIASPIHWVIAGGESGLHARPMLPDWARSLRDQCQGANVPFFLKQWGEWMPVDQMTDEQYRMVAELDPEAIGGVSRFKKASMHMDGELLFKIGKAHAGRQLDGVAWDQFPRTESN